MKIKDITDKDTEEARFKNEELSKSYLKAVIDFVKWTSTVVIGSILWISTSIVKHSGNIKTLYISSLIFFVVSLVIAIFTVSKVLKAWGNEWELAKADYSLSVLKKIKFIEPEKITQEKEDEVVRDYIKKLNKTRPYSNPKRFNRLVTLHIVFLIMGLILYTISRML
ncbi:MAG: hypothetical protein JXQ30_00715 [Spirochaetes bacterium]|nr:hypothetical protein [Spirochaetota bacterium]